jgi:hypothetical protein
MNEAVDPVDPRQRRQARRLGLIIGAGFLAVVVVFIMLFDINGLPKDPKVWKRMQEQRSAIGIDSEQPQQKDQTK